MTEPSADKPASPAEPGAAAAPPLMVSAQYVKDLSFENPRAPASFGEARNQAPKIDIGVNVGARQLQDKLFEVVLALRAQAETANGPLFLAEVQYAGLFTVGDVPQPTVEPLLLIQGPQLLFPFARAVIAESIREGGFAPLLVQPIDFVALYRQRQQQEQKGAPDGPTPGSNGSGGEA